MSVQEMLDKVGVVVISKDEFADIQRKLTRLREIEDELIGRAGKNAHAETAVCICLVGVLCLTAVAAVGQVTGWW
jgi:predicted nucleotidyltransferase